MADKKTKKLKRVVKPEKVNITSVSPVILAGENGPMTFLWGLGDDNKMYQWESATRLWIMG